MKISKIKVKEILDSKAMPTVEVELKTDFGKFIASVPSGVSTGKYEAVELRGRDEDGKGVSIAIENIEKIIAPALAREDLTDQKRVDDILIRLDGTENKSRLGANAILAVSIAVCRAIAKEKNFPLYKYISEIAAVGYGLPKPSFNMIEGGKHAHSTGSGQAALAFQEFMVVPQKSTFKENFKIGIEIYKSLKKLLENKFGKKNINLSKEGAFTVPLKETAQAIEFILEAAKNTGVYEDGIKIAIDAAASEFFENGSYKADGVIFSREQLADFYLNLIKKYPIISIEDPFAEEDYDAWSSFLQYQIPNTIYHILVFGDDLTATNLERIKMAADKNLCNALIIKPNQIGTVTETIEAAKLAKSYGWKIMVANRAGETEDDFIADLAVGIGADFIKSGAPFPKERMAKYNRLLDIEKTLKKYE